MALTLVACGNSNSKSAITGSTKTSSHQPANMDYRLSGSSQPLSAGTCSRSRTRQLTKGGASSYYTIMGDQTYLSDGHGGFRK